MEFIQAFITDKCTDIDSFEDLEKALKDPLVLKLSEEIKKSFFKFINYLNFVMNLILIKNLNITVKI